MAVQQDEQLLEEAITFIQQCYEELGFDEQQQQLRIQEIRKEIAETGTYQHTTVELAHGARMAWRNSNRCIGRLFWKTLKVFDARHVTTIDEVEQSLFNHIRYATNDGQIRSTITIFPPRRHGIDPIRLWNHQLIRYAGYEVGEGVIGDSHSIELTKKCLALGWQSNRTHFDVLPLVVQFHNEKPQLLPIPKNIVKEVPIVHPELDEVAALGVKWYAVPMISDMRLEIGGIEYPLAPFNGWYMGTEIGARNLADEERYHLLPKFAEMLGLNTVTNRSLWQDRALVELNIAVLHSYEQAGVTLVDHHTAAKQFRSFEKKEQAEGRKVTGNWTWLIPPLSPATTHIYHQPYLNDVVKPNYFYQDAPKSDQKE